MILKIALIYLLIFLINLGFKKLNYLKSSTGSSHQLFANISIPMSGGVLICFPVIFFFSQIYTEFIVIYFFIFILGILSDLNIIESPKKRFLYQIIIIIFFSFYMQLEVLPSRILIVDNFLMGTFLSFIFSSFCLMVLINGSNFIDGLNGLLLGYFLIILVILYNLNLFELISIQKENFLLLIQILLFILLLNFSNQLFLGDNGAYSFSFIIGCLLIKIYNFNNDLSPYFIILLLWYPCFENLFSILRKLIFKKNPLKPDNSHLHHHIFLLIKSKFGLKNLLANNISSITINLFNLIVLYVGSLKPYNTTLQIQLIFFSIISYTFSYFFLKRLTRKLKHN